VRSDEYEKICKRLVEVESDINTLSNNIAALDSIVKSNRARINKIKVEEIEKSGEKSLNDDGVVYLGEHRVK